MYLALGSGHRTEIKLHQNHRLVFEDRGKPEYPKKKPVLNNPNFYPIHSYPFNSLKVIPCFVTFNDAWTFSLLLTNNNTLITPTDFTRTVVHEMIFLVSEGRLRQKGLQSSYVTHDQYPQDWNLRLNSSLRASKVWTETVYLSIYNKMKVNI